jgi:putative transposase
MKETDWHHAPLHRFIPGRVFMLTAGTYEKRMLFMGDERLMQMQKTVFSVLKRRGWELHAWSFFPNHYHLILKAPEEENFGHLIKETHSKLAVALNKRDGLKGRKVMYQFWDRCISFDNSYYARLNYVMHNPVRHGVVEDALDYPFCSARWFRESQESRFRRKVASYPYDKISEPDDFEV